MSNENSTYDDDVFEDDDSLDDVVLDDEEDLDFDEVSPTTKRRMIEDLLEERRLRKEVDYDYDFDLDED